MGCHALPRRRTPTTGLCRPPVGAVLPVYEEAKLGEPVGRSVLLSIMRTAAAVDSIDKAEIGTRYWEGMLAGEQLKVLAAIAQSQPNRASWNAAWKLVAGQTRSSRAVLYRARGRLLPVVHLWAAYILRGPAIRW